MKKRKISNKSKAVRKRGDKSPSIKTRSSKKVYFTQETEDAIVLYNKCEDDYERDIIYRTHIEKPLDKLVENVINRFKFPYMDGSFEDVKAQVVSFLVINLHKYAENKGKAFSYFSVIAKNYLIAHNNSAYKEEKRSVYFNDQPHDQFSLEEMLITQPDDRDTKSDLSEFFRLTIQYWDFYLTKFFKKKRDIEIANAIIELMRHVDSIDNFNKKALYVMVREMTNYKTAHVTKVINKMRGLMLSQLQEFRRSGYISDPAMYFEYKNRKSYISK